MIGGQLAFFAGVIAIVLGARTPEPFARAALTVIGVVQFSIGVTVITGELF